MRPVIEAPETIYVGHPSGVRVRTEPGNAVSLFVDLSGRSAPARHGFWIDVTDKERLLRYRSRADSLGVADMSRVVPPVRHGARALLQAAVRGEVSEPSIVRVSDPERKGIRYTCLSMHPGWHPTRPDGSLIDQSGKLARYCPMYDLVLVRPMMARYVEEAKRRWPGCRIVASTDQLLPPPSHGLPSSYYLQPAQSMRPFAADQALWMPDWDNRAVREWLIEEYLRHLGGDVPWDGWGHDWLWTSIAWWHSAGDDALHRHGLQQFVREMRAALAENEYGQLVVTNGGRLDDIGADVTLGEGHKYGGNWSDWQCRAGEGSAAIVYAENFGEQTERNFLPAVASDGSTDPRLINRDNWQLWRYWWSLLAIHDSRYVGYSYSGYNVWWEYDEMHLSLGEPTGPAVENTDTGLYVRHHELGAIVHWRPPIGASDATQTVTRDEIASLLGTDRALYHVRGQQDPRRNSGELFESVVLRGGLSSMAFAAEPQLLVGDGMALSYDRPLVAVAPVVVGNSPVADSSPGTLPIRTDASARTGSSRTWSPSNLEDPNFSWFGLFDASGDAEGTWASVHVDCHVPGIWQLQGWCGEPAHGVAAWFVEQGGGVAGHGTWDQRDSPGQWHRLWTGGLDVGTVLVRLEAERLVVDAVRLVWVGAD